MTAVVEELRRLRNSDIVDVEQYVTAAELTGVVCSLLDELELSDDKEGIKFYRWTDKLRVRGKYPDE